MANEVVYKIILSDETQGEKVAKKAGGAGGIQTSTSEREEKGGEKSGKAKAKDAFKAVFVYNAVKSVATNITSYRVSTVQLRTGSSDAQQKANFWYNAGQKAFSLGESVATGAMFGGGIGAAIGLAVGVANQLIDISQNVNRFNLQKQLEETTQDLSTQRETTSGSRYQSAGQI